MGIKEQRRGIYRVRRTIELLQEGRTTQEIDGHLSGRSKLEPLTEAEKRGRAAERRVAKIIRERDYVDNVRVTTPLDADDRRLRDLIVFIPELEELGLGDTYIQVKSSVAGIQKFQRIVQERHGVPYPYLRDFLASERMALLHGWQEEERIVGSYESQLDAIIRHAQARRNSTTRGIHSLEELKNMFR